MSDGAASGPAAGAGVLAFTGTNSITVAGIAAAAVLAGLALLRFSKKLTG